MHKHNVITFQAWADSHINFPYHVRALSILLHLIASCKIVNGCFPVAMDVKTPKLVPHKIGEASLAYQINQVYVLVTGQ